MPPEINHNEVNHEVTVILLKKIIELLDVKEERPETLKADEIRAALRNELAAVVKSIKALPDNSDILKELKKLTQAIGAIELTPNISVSAAEVNIPEIKIPEINVPQVHYTPPAVNYTPPEINIPQTIVNVEAPTVNVPEVDLSAIIKSLELNLNKLRTNSETRPLAVRMSDGQKWVKELQQLNQHAAQTTQFMSDVSYIRNAAGARINPATSEDLKSPSTISDNYKDVATAGTRVPLVASTTACRYVIITAKENNTDTVWVGGATVAAGRGRPLVALQSEKIDVDDVSKIYIDSVVNGEGCTFVYVT